MIDVVVAFFAFIAGFTLSAGFWFFRTKSKNEKSNVIELDPLRKSKILRATLKTEKRVPKVNNDQKAWLNEQNKDPS